MRTLGLRVWICTAVAVMGAVLDQWETTNAEYGGDSDFTAIVKMIEKRAGVVVGTEKKR